MARRGTLWQRFVENARHADHRDTNKYNDCVKMFSDEFRKERIHDPRRLRSPVVATYAVQRKGGSGISRAAIKNFERERRPRSLKLFDASRVNKFGIVRIESRIGTLPGNPGGERRKKFQRIDPNSNRFETTRSLLSSLRLFSNLVQRCERFREIFKFGRLFGAMEHRND